MTAMDLEEFKARLIESIHEARDWGELWETYYTLLEQCEEQLWGSIPGVPTTVEEVRQDIAAFEAETDAGIAGTPHEEVNALIGKEFPWLQ